MRESSRLIADRCVQTVAASGGRVVHSVHANEHGGRYIEWRSLSTNVQMVESVYDR